MGPAPFSFSALTLLTQPVMKGTARWREPRYSGERENCTMSYLSPRKRWYQRTIVRVIFATAVVYALLTAVLVVAFNG
jgi:hypothetical protein